MNKTKGNIPNDDPSMYKGLRTLAFDITAEQIGVELPIGQVKAFGVIMDWDLVNGIMTLTSFLSGDASLYVSSGGGILGGVQHEDVKKAAITFVESAERYIGKTQKVDSINIPPGSGGINFYILTNKGRYLGWERMGNIENGTSEWMELFNEANQVITQLRMKIEKT